MTGTEPSTLEWLESARKPLKFDGSSASYGHVDKQLRHAKPD